MNRNSFKSNWASKAITLLAFLSVTVAMGHADTVQIEDYFQNGYSGINGQGPDTTNVNNQTWIANNFSSYYSPSYNPAAPGPFDKTKTVLTTYSGNGNNGAAIAITQGQTTTVSANMYVGKGSPLGLGFSLRSAGTVDSGNVSNIFGNNNGTVSDALYLSLNMDGTGNLYAPTSATDFAADLSFKATTNYYDYSVYPPAFNDTDSTVGLNGISLSYNSATGETIVSENGNTVLDTTLATGLDLTYAGGSEYYGLGWNNGGTDPDGFNDFKVSTFTPPATPEPSTMALLFAGVAGLVFFRRFRSTSVRS